MKPVLERAVQERDASILLATRWSPVANLAKQRNKARVLGALGASVKVEMPAELEALVEKASSLRGRSKILMSVEGNAAELLERGWLVSCPDSSKNEGVNSRQLRSKEMMSTQKLGCASSPEIIRSLVYFGDM